jgi:hypothetical protein
MEIAGEMHRLANEANLERPTDLTIDGIFVNVVINDIVVYIVFTCGKQARDYRSTYPEHSGSLQKRPAGNPTRKHIFNEQPLAVGQIHHSSHTFTPTPMRILRRVKVSIGKLRRSQKCPALESCLLSKRPGAYTYVPRYTGARPASVIRILESAGSMTDSDLGPHKMRVVWHSEDAFDKSK